MRELGDGDRILLQVFVVSDAALNLKKLVEECRSNVGTSAVVF